MRVTCSPRWAPLAWALLAAAGCSSDPHKPYPIKGVILFENGQPAKELAGYSVTFMPTSGEGLPSSFGNVEEDGTFVLSCKRQGDGAVAGKHQVVVAPVEHLDAVSYMRTLLTNPNADCSAATPPQPAPGALPGQRSAFSWLSLI